MASYSFQLPLSVAPEVRDPEMFNELLRVYNSVKILAAKLDEYTGMTPAEAGTKTFEESLGLGRLMKFGAECNQVIESGRMITILSSGKVSKPGYSAVPPNAPIRALSLGDYEKGETGEFLMAGLITFETPDLIAGANYVHDFKGYLAQEDPTPTRQGVGFALDSSHLWFQPDVHWVYTVP